MSATTASHVGPHVAAPAARAVGVGRYHCGNELNGMSLLVPAAEVYPFVMTAAVVDLSFDEIARWLASWAS